MIINSNNEEIISLRMIIENADVYCACKGDTRIEFKAWRPAARDISFILGWRSKTRRYHSKSFISDYSTKH